MIKGSTTRSGNPGRVLLTSRNSKNHFHQYVPLWQKHFFHCDSIPHDKAWEEWDYCGVNTTLIAVEESKKPQCISSDQNVDSQCSIDQT